MEDPVVPQSPPRRCGAADPASERLQDLRRHRARPGGRRRRDRAAGVTGLGPGGRLRRRPAGRVRANCSPRWPTPTIGSSRSRPRLDPVDRARQRHRPGRRSSCAPRRDGPAPTSSTASRSRAPSAPTRCRWSVSARTPTTCAGSKSGCGPTTRTTSSIPTGGWWPSCAALAPAGDKRMSASPYANGGRLLAPLPASVLADTR